MTVSVRSGRSAGLSFALAAAITTLVAAGARSQESVDPAVLAQPGPLPDFALGSPDAPVTIYEFASMTCDACAAANEVLPALRAQYIATGQVRYILREFPFAGVSIVGEPPLSELGIGVDAFMLARCHAGTAGAEGYYSLIDALFRRQEEWMVYEAIAPLRAITARFGMTADQFDACLFLDADGTPEEQQANEDMLFWVLDSGLGVNAAPTFFVNGQRYVGALTLEDFQAILDPLLAAAGVEANPPPADAGEPGAATEPPPGARTISWGYDAQYLGVASPPGATATLFCPATTDTGVGVVWGTDVYTGHSSVCTAAVHAGLITAAGGAVTVEALPGQTAYVASDRNGVESFDRGSYGTSFRFVTAAGAAPQAGGKDAAIRPSAGG